MKLKKSKVAMAVSTALFGISYMPHVLAEDVLEEIVVTGIRGSLERAQDMKREAVGVMDAITAEDLGKFPDSNIAESLQRITGVTIDRNGGEGQFVTVRGFGPSFNTVLVNGRRLVSETGGREFSFDLYPAELISGAEIYKTGTAHLQEGGIGSTINLKTARPLDFKEDKIVATAKALYEKNSDKTTPELFGLYSHKFNDSMGFLLSASYQKRKSQDDFLWTNGWLPTPVSSLSLAPGGNPNNVTTAFIPRETQSGRRSQERTRTNIQGVFQADLSDTTRLTVDGFYNDFKVDSSATMLGSWFGDPGAISNVRLASNGTVLSEDIHSEVGILNRLEGRPTKTHAIGFNLDMHPSDELEAIFDVSYSHSEAKQGKGNGQAVMGFVDDFSFVNDGRYAYVVYPNAVDAKIANRDSYLSHVAQFGDQAGDGTGGNSVVGKVYNLKFDGVYTPSDGGMLKNIRFGSSFTNEDKTVDILRPSFDVFCMFCGFTVDVPNSLLSPFDTSGLLSGLPGGITRDFYNFNLQDYIAWQSSPAGFAARDAALGLAPGTSQTFFNSQPGGFIGTRQPDSYAVTEKTVAVYGDTTLDGKWASVGWTLNLGARLVWTKTEAEGNQQKLLQIFSSSPSPTQYGTVFDTSGDGFQTESNDYLKLLPNLNLTLRPTDSLVVRFGVSETMTRPELKDLSPRLSYADLRPGSLNASGGNVNLKPYTSTNIDVSFEYYFAKLNYVTLAAFRKEVQDFIVTDSQTETVAVTANIVNTDPLINTANGTANFTVQRPRNAEVATVDGIEIAAQYVFDFGLGISANATFLRSNAEISSNSSISRLFAIPGLGNSKNVQVFYEGGPIELRASWSRRDEFLESLVNPKAGVEPVFTDRFDQIDARFTYKLTDNYSTFVEGTNIASEKINKHGRYSNQFIQYRDTGPRYALGFRASF